MSGGSSPKPVPLSEREQAQWFLQTITPDAGVANIALALHLRRPVQLPAVHEALRHVLERHPAVRAAAVVVRDAGLATATTAAFVVADGGATGEQLSAFAADRLPGYAVPATVTLLTRMPTTTSGKVDYDRLASLPVAGTAARNGDEPPATVDPLTDRLKQLWREALGTAAVDADSHFFRNGGHSVLAALLVARIGKELAVDLALSSLFRSPTPRLLAAELARMGTAPATTVAAPAPADIPAAADHVGTPWENVSSAPRAGRGDVDVAQWLRSFWSKILRVDEIRPDDDVFDMGANSIAATQLITDVQAAFGVRLRLSQLFDYPTVRQLSGAITGLMRHTAEAGSE